MAASVSLLSLTVILIISGSTTQATVDVVQSQSNCNGIDARMTCVTTTNGGFLEWRMNGASVFSVGPGETTSFNQTIGESDFFFVGGISAFGVNVYTSTVSLKTIPTTTTLSCSDNFAIQALVIGFDNQDAVQCNNVFINDDSAVVSWSLPNENGAEICCNRYNVVTSNGTTENITAREYTLYIETPEERKNASITVRCMDQIGTMGPPVFYPLNITLEMPTVSYPEHIGGNKFQVAYDIPESSRDIVRNCSAIVILDSDETISVNCGVYEEELNITIPLSGLSLSPFRVCLTFNFGLGFDNITLFSPEDGQYVTSTIMEAGLSADRARQINQLYIACGILAACLLIAIIVIIILLIIFCVCICYKKDNIPNKTPSMGMESYDKKF